MEKKWKLVHKTKYHLIENNGGLTLGYSPGAGIRILEDDGFAFKDFNDNGKIDVFEDWRYPLIERVKAFAKFYHLDQDEKNLLYFGKPVAMLEELHLSQMFNDLLHHHLSQDYKSIKQLDGEDERYLQEHYLLVVLVMMMDNVRGFATHDYHVQVFIQGLQSNMIDHIIYSLGVSVKEFLEKMQTGRPQILQKEA
ncbi:MAG: hypothetical protein RSC59_05455 [Erysipelotrichaceae bacterium]